ncbi:MAG TPA: RecT family recombinase [Candidatus Udaeobacter sp.]|nr:RecT family recombinase [Candidatus Udaeobacter sp.]
MKTAALCTLESADLRACLTTQAGKISMIRALQRAAATGLSLNPQEGKAALVPINGKVEYWPMKNGIIDLAHESGKVDYIAAETVFAKDTFALKKTAKGDDYEFSPALAGRGEPVAYFAVVALTGGRSIVKYMDKAQIEAHKQKYAKGLSGSKSAWNTNFNGMAEKTVLKALLKSVYLGSKVQKAIDIDDELSQESGQPDQKGTAPTQVAEAVTMKQAEIVEHEQVAEDAEAETGSSGDGQMDIF